MLALPRQRRRSRARRRCLGSAVFSAQVPGQATVVTAPDGGLLAHLPEPLKADLLDGRWLPIVGAGLSRNAVLPDGGHLPDWKGLGEALEGDLSASHRGWGAVESISAYEQAYGRSQLTSRVARALRLGVASPGPTQLAFARLSFEHVVTTNVEQLLEDAYRRVRGSVFSVIEDAQLRMRNPYDSPTLVKLHGDLHNPSSLVLTEEDYDRVNVTRPLLLTWLANQLISKTGVLIGYSLDDPDVRAILATLRERLGAVPPDLWVLTVGDNPVAADRYRRRGVRVVSLPDAAGVGWAALETLFDELQRYWDEGIREKLSGTTSAVDAALRAGAAVDSLVLFLVKAGNLSLYSDYVFPTLARAGLLPVSREDVRAPEGYGLAATDGLLRAAGRVVVEVETRDDPDARRAAQAVGEENVLLVATPTSAGLGAHSIPAPTALDQWDAFGAQVSASVSSMPGSVTTTRGRESRSAEQPLRVRALVALIDLEAALRGVASDIAPSAHTDRSVQPLRRLLSLALEEGLFPEQYADAIPMLVGVRNALVHGGRSPVPEADLDMALSIAEQALALLHSADSAGDSPDGSVVLDQLLQTFEISNPQAPHRSVVEHLQSAGFRFQPPRRITPSSRTYARWTREGAKRRITLYQESGGIMIDSKMIGDFASHLPGASRSGRRVLIPYDGGSAANAIRAIDALRQHADEP